MAKRKVPSQLRQHTFKRGGTRAVTAGAKGGRKSPGTGQAATAGGGSATPTKAPTKPAKTKTTKGSKAKRTRRS
jgi:hypothetical protein